MSLNGDLVVLRNGRSTSQISVYNYPEHLNPFYEEDQHKRIRFWKINKEGRRNSFSISNLKDLWAFKPFNLKKKSSTLGINKSSESPPLIRRQLNGSNHFETNDKYLNAHNSPSLHGHFKRDSIYRSSLQNISNNGQSYNNAFNRNDYYRNTIQVPRTSSSPKAPQVIRSSQTSLASTNPFESDDDYNDHGTSQNNLSIRRTRKKRRAPNPPTRKNLEEQSISSSINIDGDSQNVSLQNENEIDISNLTAEIVDFVKISSDEFSETNKPKGEESKESSNDKILDLKDVIRNDSTLENSSPQRTKLNSKNYSTELRANQQNEITNRANKYEDLSPLSAAEEDVVAVKLSIEEVEDSKSTTNTNQRDGYIKSDVIKNHQNKVLPQETIENNANYQSSEIVTITTSRTDSVIRSHDISNGTVLNSTDKVLKTFERKPSLTNQLNRSDDNQSIKTSLVKTEAESTDCTFVKDSSSPKEFKKLEQSKVSNIEKVNLSKPSHINNKTTTQSFSDQTIAKSELSYSNENEKNIKGGEIMESSASHSVPTANDDLYIKPLKIVEEPSISNFNIDTDDQSPKQTSSLQTSFFTDEQKKSVVKRKSVKDIIDSINRSQRLLNESAAKGTQIYTTPVYNDISKNSSRLNTFQNSNFVGCSTSENDSLEKKNNLVTDIEKYKVNKAMNQIREYSPTSSNLDWNPVPKPKRTKNLQDD